MRSFSLAIICFTLIEPIMTVMEAEEYLETSLRSTNSKFFKISNQIHYVYQLIHSISVDNIREKYGCLLGHGNMRPEGQKQPLKGKVGTQAHFRRKTKYIII